MKLKGFNIVLGISGGIAAYKSVTLLRLLVKEGAEVQVVMTPSGREFITPVTLSALSGKPVVSEFFSANTGEWHSHVDLGLWADLMIVAPATANTIAKMAYGVADNMLVTTYLSAKEPVMIAPAMDMDMFVHPSTQRNLDILRKDGVIILDSPAGSLASGLVGKGRMLEPEHIFESVVKFLTGRQNRELQGVKVLITAGPTHERIDPVRYIGNNSSGKMGFALAEEFVSRGADVHVICGPVGIIPPCSKEIQVTRIVSAEDMYQKVSEYYNECDISVFAAAVADYRPETYIDKKIKREKEEVISISLVRNPDIASEMGKLKKKNQINVGFALETDNGIENARKKLESKNLDFIVLNPAGTADAGFNTDTNRITIISRKGNRAQELPLLTKRECAAYIVDSIGEYYKEKK